MPDSYVPDELDIAIVDSLSIHPRASWIAVADALGSNASTVARRWDRLKLLGLAWTLCVRDYTALAVQDHLDIRCRPGFIEELAALFCEVKCCLTVSAVSGNADLRILVDVPDISSLHAFMNHEVWRNPGIVSVEHNIATEVFQTARGWVSGSLSLRQRTALRQSITVHRPALARLTAREEQIAIILQRDARTSASDIADELGMSLPSASRQISRLIASNKIELRAEAAHAVVGWPISVCLYSQVKPGRLRAAAAGAAKLPRSRATHTVVSPRWNLMTIYWMRDLADIHRIEEALETSNESLTVVARQVTLKSYKRMGMIFDANARAVRNVLTDL
ncbi:Lrp/AsnC family transcriptional regulator [Cryobacterium psychrophilum]|uniref:AsnC family transcriptional regulator n=1 Tax=Cryobacterium psychrophilum TaxID=41988 RepID=A0A4Y8KL76_9MICO|nr:Lrp/AsnC family transcriptional regulator [Cryobacterium psychrophilum]TDW29825.1 DNA-binding Lrp family transcriptional regulator [Cryobacterium psychrophilum]TFD76786.1 AsnC family transcriptional regulator [Cryobacterium psychrophilum]